MNYLIKKIASWFGDESENFQIGDEVVSSLPKSSILSKSPVVTVYDVRTDGYICLMSDNGFPWLEIHKSSLRLATESERISRLRQD